MEKALRILVASDAHGKFDNLKNILNAEQFDRILYLGDGEGLENELAFYSNCPPVVCMVRGNNDYSPYLKEEAVVTIGNHKAFLAHGHRFRLFEGLSAIGTAAGLKDCDICLFGHIHRPVLGETGGIFFMNPGSVSEPRQEGHEPTYGIITVFEDRIEAEIRSAVNFEPYGEFHQSLRN